MRTEKRYTNTTFTHRPEPADDPRAQEAPAEPIICAGCGAVYTHKRWSHSASARLRARRAGQPIEVRICGACCRKQTGVPHGFVHLDGDFVRTHRDDVVRLLKNEAARAAEDNPLAQIVRGTTAVTATTCWSRRRPSTSPSGWGGRWKRPTTGACSTGSPTRINSHTFGGIATRNCPATLPQVDIVPRCVGYAEST